MTKNSTTVNVRELAMEALLMVFEEKKTSSEVLGGILKKYQYLPKQDRAFLSRLSEGTMECAIELDFIINQFSKVKVKKMKPVIRTVIRMGTYQILYMDQVPDSAACNESVKLAERKGFRNLKGFVNGVLRNISRNKDSLTYPDPKKDLSAYLSVKYSMPQWLVDMWLTDYKQADVEKMLASFIEESETTIRVNTRKTDMQAYRKLLSEAGIEVSNGNYVKEALHIKKYNYINTVPGFSEGMFTVQDESSMLSVLCAGIQEGMDILDVCAAPGGKSLFAAWLLNGTGSIMACDVSEYKTARIEENAKRLGYENLVTKVKDATVLDSTLVGTKDLVIADVPCSGLGVIGKKPDIKYNCTKEGINNLVEVQRAILANVQEYVKENGVLMFSTCTVCEQENMENVFWFLENFSFELESITPYLPDELCGESTDAGYLKLLPGIHKTDGFFVARFRKRK